MTTIIKDNLLYINKLKKMKFCNSISIIIVIILILEYIIYYWTNMLS